jgi:muramoyltetrapeptide carboxypeptidase
MVKPPSLKTGDRIRIISPAGKVKREEVFPAVEWLQGNGYEVICGRHMFDEYFQFAGTDANRISDLQDALNDHETKAIICSRGGYGTIRLLSEVSYTEFIKYPKWVVGFSDITVLHCCLNNIGCSSIHGVMPKLFFNDMDSNLENLKSLFNLLVGKKAFYSQDFNQSNREGIVTGELVGGNLSIIYSLQATNSSLKADNKILFIEDTSEYLYHIERMIFNLKLSGILKNLKGLIIGDFSDIKDNEDPFGMDVNEIIWNAVKEYNYPVCFGFPAGHKKANLALSFGCDWNLVINKAGLQLSMI